MHHAGSQRIELYFGVTGHADDPDYHRLLADIESERLAGVMLLNWMGFDPQVLRAWDVPKVFMNSSPLADSPGLYLDVPALIDKGLDCLVEAGRKRVAVLGGGWVIDHERHLLEAMRRRRMVHRTHWGFAVMPSAGGRPHTPHVGRYVRALMDARERPDGLLILEDLFVEHVLDGVLDAGLRVGEDIDVVAHCNYPLLKPDQLPVRRVGFWLRQVVHRFTELVARRRASKKTPKRSVIKPLLDVEYALETAKAAVHPAPRGLRALETH